MTHPSQPPPTLDTAIHLKVGALLGGDAAFRGFALYDVVKCLTILHRDEFGACSHCTGEASVLYPCATMKVVAAALGLKDGDWR